MQVSRQRAKCKCTCDFTASAAETRAVNEVVPPSFTLQSYEIEDPIYSEFDMLQREKSGLHCFIVK